MNHLTRRALRKAVIRFAIFVAVCGAHPEVILFAAIAGGALWLIH